MVGTSVIALNFTFNFIFHNIFITWRPWRKEPSGNW